MKNNLVLKVVIGVLVVLIVGLTIKLVITNSKLKIGDNYGGGKIAYILQTGDPGYVARVQHGLIAASGDQSTGIVWHATNSGTTGATGTELGTGLANTKAIVALYGTESNAARLCYDLSLNGYTDWYLPSKDELNKLYLSRMALGGFTANYFWSSSENSFLGARGRYFSNGNQASNDKYDLEFVRCVRSF